MPIVMLMHLNHFQQNPLRYMLEKTLRETHKTNLHNYICIDACKNKSVEFIRVHKDKDVLSTLTFTKRYTKNKKKYDDICIAIHCCWY